MVPQTLGSFRLELLEALRKGDQAWIQENSFKTVTVCGKNLNAKQLPQALAKLDLPSVAQVIEAAAPGTEVCKPTGIGFANGELWVRYWDEVESPVIQAINVNCKRN